MSLRTTHRLKMIISLFLLSMAITTLDASPTIPLEQNERIISPKEEQYITHVKNSIASAEQHSSKLTPSVLRIEGMSSPKIRHFLNNLCSMPNTNYLEIGCWKGATFISALYRNQGTITSATVIDSWREFGGPKSEFTRNCDTFLRKVPFNLISSDCFTVNRNAFKKPINIYLYDGDHSAEAQEKAFTYFDSVLDDLFIVLVDDWNWPQVKNGTFAAFDKLKYQVLFEKSLSAKGSSDQKGWWNGLYVAVVRKHPHAKEFTYD